MYRVLLQYDKIFPWQALPNQLWSKKNILKWQVSHPPTRYSEKGFHRTSTLPEAHNSRKTTPFRQDAKDFL